MILKNYYNSFVGDLNPLNSSFVNVGILMVNINICYLTVIMGPDTWKCIRNNDAGLTSLISDRPASPHSDSDVMCSYMAGT